MDCATYSNPDAFYVISLSIFGYQIQQGSTQGLVTPGSNLMQGDQIFVINGTLASNPLWFFQTVPNSENVIVTNAEPGAGNVSLSITSGDPGNSNAAGLTAQNTTGLVGQQWFFTSLD